MAKFFAGIFRGIHYYNEVDRNGSQKKNRARRFLPSRACRQNTRQPEEAGPRKKNGGSRALVLAPVAAAPAPAPPGNPTPAAPDFLGPCWP